jgi:hypothetical protein
MTVRDNRYRFTNPLEVDVDAEFEFAAGRGRARMGRTITTRSAQPPCERDHIVLGQWAPKVPQEHGERASHSSPSYSGLLEFDYLTNNSSKKKQGQPWKLSFSRLSPPLAHLSPLSLPKSKQETAASERHHTARHTQPNLKRHLHPTRRDQREIRGTREGGAGGCREGGEGGGLGLWVVGL